MPAKAPQANWARLSAGIVYDPDWLEADAAGRLCFMVSIALAKGANLDGEFSLRVMTGVMHGAVPRPKVISSAADLCRLGLWEHVEGDRYRVTNYLRWNEGVADQEDRRERKRTGARIANHKQGRHDASPDDECPLCRSSDRSTDRSSDRSCVASETLDADADADADADPPLQVPPRSTVPAAVPPAEEVAVVELADQLVAALGYVSPEPARPDERRYVARALAKGWTPDQLEDLAYEAASREGVDDVRGYLRGGLRTRANEAPPAPAGPALAEARPLLHDQRPPCPNPGCVDGWVGGLDDGTGRPGPVERCPDCTGVRA